MKYAFYFIIFLPMCCFAKTDPPNLKIFPLADNVYQYTSYKYVEPWGMVGANGLIVIEGNNAHMIDTPWELEDTKELVNWIQSKHLTLKSAVATHFHEDASAGIAWLNQLNIATYATTKTNELLQLKNAELASHPVNATTYQIVTDTIELFYPGAGHTQDNNVVWLPKAKILFGGCFVKSANSKNLGNIADASIHDWPISINHVIQRYSDVTLVVPGHGAAGNTDLLKHTADLALKAELIKK